MRLVQEQPSAAPFLVVPSRSSRKPAIRPGPTLSWVYVMTGQSDGTNPNFLVEAEGMLEIDVTCTAPQQVSAFQNRFAAEIVVNGTTWNQVVIPLVLNVLDGNSCVSPANGNPVELIAGEAPQEFSWFFSFTSGFTAARRRLPCDRGSQPGTRRRGSWSIPLAALSGTYIHGRWLGTNPTAGTRHNRCILLRKCAKQRFLHDTARCIRGQFPQCWTMRYI
jgi:hypothetical protein